MTEHLFRPWRGEYVMGPRKQGCFMCEGLAGIDDEAALILARAPAAFIVLNRFPYNSGHLMVAPNRHVGRIEELSPEERLAVMDLAAAAVAALTKEMAPDGFNLGANLGTVAGAGLPGHFHVHVVPRWNGDTNFMPVVGGAKVLPEALEDTYSRMRGYFPRA